MAAGDMLCDSTNNNADCKYDGGDCCRSTCKEICTKKGLTGDDCRCGENSYNCKSENAPCEQCVHGTCETNMTRCYSDDEYVKIAVGACSLNGMVQGTTNTSDYYCGKDPDKSVIHYSSTPSYHFPGCGIKSINCTENPCCEVVALNHDTYDNCDSTTKSMYVWDPTKKNYVLQFTSCIEYYRQCFKENAASFPRGQCCQCEDGWGGTFCDVPLCKQCLHGTCIDENTCICDSQYEGAGCSKPICKKCVHGVCVEPEVCNCYYGYTGKYCDEIVSYPFCIHGKYKEGDKCECDAGYEGRLCEIKICDNTNGNCDYCDDEGGCYEQLEKKCDSINPFCLECDVVGKICTKCDKNYIIDNSGNCVHVSKKFKNCLLGDDNQCFECTYPNVLKEGKCVSGGMVEISQEHFSPFDSDEYLLVNFYRYYGSDGECSINYEIFPINLYVFDYNYITNPVDKMQMSYGEILFKDGETEKELKLKLYKGIYHYDGYNHKNTFMLTIYNPVGGCVLGDISKSSIEIYEETIENENNINLIIESVSKIENVNPDSNYIYQIDHTITEISFTITLNNDLLPLQAKFFGLGLLADRDCSSVEKMILMSFDNSISKYKGNLQYADIKEKDESQLKYLIIMLCKTESPLYKLKFYDHAGFIENETPYYIRHSNNIEIDEFYINNKKAYYSIEYEFYVELIKTIFYIKISFKKSDEMDLYINRKKCIPYSNTEINDVLINIYEIKEDSFKTNKLLEMIIRFIHTTGDTLISIEYSEDNISYSKENLFYKSYICEEIELFNLNAH